MIKGRLPWYMNGPDHRFWENPDDLLTTNWLQQKGIYISKETARDAIDVVARDNSFHPVMDYLSRTEWDGVHRIDTWTIDYLGVEDTPFVRATGAKWLISGVARIYVPGCKADCALIIEGKQGLLKSTALKTLFHPWFTDEISDLGSKDAAMQIAGKWGIEMSELDSMRRTEVSKVKAFMSRTMDRFRPPYGYRVVEQLRQCIMAGTVNENQYLRDDTGNRRFWPHAGTKIDIPKLSDDRDQLWAEAKTKYLLEEPWWLDSDELITQAREAQSARRVEDPWENEISNMLKLLESTTPSELLLDLGKDKKDLTQADQNRAASCLRALGWERKSIRYKGKPTWRYVPPM